MAVINFKVLPAASAAASAAAAAANSIYNCHMMAMHCTVYCIKNYTALPFGPCLYCRLCNELPFNTPCAVLCP